MLSKDDINGDAPGNNCVITLLTSRLTILIFELLKN
jgi:hypothetical protein